MKIDQEINLNRISINRCITRKKRYIINKNTDAITCKNYKRF